MQKTNLKPPSLLGIGQPYKRFGAFLVLVAQKGAVAIASLADAKGQAVLCVAKFMPCHLLPSHLSALRWPRHLLPKASINNSLCRLNSANIFLSRPLSASMVFICEFIDASMEPCRASQLKEDALLISYSWKTRHTATPPHRHIALGLAQDREALWFHLSAGLHLTLLTHLATKILLNQPPTLWGDCPRD